MNAKNTYLQPRYHTERPINSTSTFVKIEIKRKFKALMKKEEISRIRCDIRKSGS